MAFQITTNAFIPGGNIPMNFTAEGPNKSPLIRWDGAPPETQSFALIMEDPDVEGEAFVHWMVYDIPKEATQLDPELSHEDLLPNGTKQGVNDAEVVGYYGPKPPSGQKHQYVFRLYALKDGPGLNIGMRKGEFLEKIKERGILAQTEITGFYKSLKKPKRAAG